MSQGTGGIEKVSAAESAEPRNSEASLGELEAGQRGWSFALLGGQAEPLARIECDSHDDAARTRESLRSVLQGAIVRRYVRRDRTPLHDEPPAKAAADSSLRQWAYTLLEEGQLESVTGRVIEFFLIALIIANVAAVALESIPAINDRFHNFFVVFEEFSLVAYTLEYVIRVWASPEDPRVAARGPIKGRIAFVLRPLMIIDFLAFAPSYLGLFFGIDLRVLRIFRLFRLLKLARYSQALQALFGVFAAERSSLFASLILLLATVCLEGEMMHLAEGGIQPEKLGTMPNAMYWAITTLATVGYGDITPITPLGKLIAAATMVTGLALFALPVGIIANGFVTGLSRRRFAINWTMLRRQPLLRGFNLDALNDIMETALAAVVREHAHVAIAGKDAEEFYLIVAGSARAETTEGIRELGPGDTIGAEALHLSTRYASTVTAESDMRLIVFSGDELRRLARKYPVLADRVGQSLPSVGSGGAVDPAQRVKELQDENARLRQALCDLALKKLVPDEGA
ncbi:MAG TPA: cyclic nucleotide-gated ion channel [Rhizomicrobium sp.]